jgi:ATP adenylyltransferase
MSEDKGNLERLWAPWRMAWIRESSAGADGCFICDHLSANPSHDRENLILHRGEQAVILMNRYPYSNGHVMIAPLRHLADPRHLSPEEWAEIGLLTGVIVEALEQTMKPHGFNIGWNIGRVSGAGLESHIHQHVVPRWDGDTNFMPIVGGTKVLSQALEESYDELKSALEAIKKNP